MKFLCNLLTVIAGLNILCLFGMLLFHSNLLLWIWFWTYPLGFTWSVRYIVRRKRE